MDWKEENNKLCKDFKAISFTDLTQKLIKIAAISDGMDHHPDFKVWGYNKIKFELSTHTSNAVTDLDYRLAKAIDGVFL
jgi:4a-hydroxytetrahydrobiopterin dehydratase